MPTRTPAPRRKRAPSAGSYGRDGAATRRRRGGNLVIVESPAKARTVKNILGDDFEVIASVGHVRDLPERGYGVADIKQGDFTPKYVPVPGREKVINQIKSAAQSAERVYLSTDPDREGEAIAWHIAEAAGIPVEKAQRVVFHEITRPAIQEAFQHPGTLDMHLVDAQQTRRVLDRLIGYPLTWFVQRKVSRGASAGRVQSVALRLIVERERAIQQFRALEYWSIHAQLSPEAQPPALFWAELQRVPHQARRSLKPGKDREAFQPLIPSETDADRLVETFERCQFSVATVKKGERSKSPAPPFTTSTFQQAANNRLGMGARRAMAVAQQLYEGVNLRGEGSVGLITYMRTDSLSVSPVARREARAAIARLFGPEFVPAKERVYRARTRGAQEAHEAIRPTSPGRTPDSLHGLTAEQMRVYRLIWQRFMASQMADARFATVQVDIAALEGGEERGTFRASSQHLLFAGHLAVYGVDVNERASSEEDEDAEASLPPLTEGQDLRRLQVEGHRHETEPLPRYTEASLVKALEEQGIGRPSTYATIVQTVQKRDYVKKEGRALVPQELGFTVNDLLVEHFDRYVAVPFTSGLEEHLDAVAAGTTNYHEVVSGFWTEFQAQEQQARESAERVEEPTDILCDVCGQANMVIRWGRYGKFLACPRYPECKNSRPLTQEGEPAPVVTPQRIDIRCPVDGGTLLKKTGPYGEYVDCENRESGACVFRSGVPVGVACPEDGGQLVEKKSRRGTFYGCWLYPNCSYTTNSLEPAKMSPARSPEEREKANARLLERSARGKSTAAKRRSTRARGVRAARR